jgi:hypothetical protein
MSKSSTRRAILAGAVTMPIAAATLPAFAVPAVSAATFPADDKLVALVAEVRSVWSPSFVPRAQL